MKERVLILSIFIPGLFFICISCHRPTTEEKNPKSELEISGETIKVVGHSSILTKLKLEVVDSQDYPSKYITTATVQPMPGQFAKVSAPFEGRIIRSFVKLGQRVRVGTPLFEISSAEYYESVKAYLASKQEKELAEKNYQRKKDLLDHEVGSRREFEEAEAEYQGALKEYERAEATMGVFQVKGEDAVIAKPMVVRSPIVGEVVQYHMTVGQFQRNDDEAVVTVAELGKVWVVAHVKENCLSMVHQDDEVLVYADAYPDRPIKGHVEYVGNLMDEQTRSVEVFLECENGERLLKPGMFAKVCFVHPLRDVLVIPESAVLQEEDHSFLYLQEGENRYVKRQVVLKDIGDRHYLVEAGLAPGDRIVAEGGVYLH